MTNLFPGAQCGIGPATDEGFFYDFVVERPFVPEDLDAIEKKMKELAAQDLPYERQMWPRDEAKQLLRQQGRAAQGPADRGEDRRASPRSPVYTIKDRDTFVDFCVGPHVPSTGTAEGVQAAEHVERLLEGRRAATSRCSASTAPRSSATSELKAHLQRIEEAKKRDHRKVGKELGLFTFHPWAPGAAFWLSKGTTLYNTLANYMRDVLFPAGYVEVKTPLIFNKALWETSGPLAALPREHVPHRVRGRSRWP